MLATAPTPPGRSTDRTLHLQDPGPIDFVDLSSVSRFLGIPEHDVISLVEAAHLAAYDFGEGLRFRALDVIALGSESEL